MDRATQLQKAVDLLPGLLGVEEIRDIVDIINGQLPLHQQVGLDIEPLSFDQVFCLPGELLLHIASFLNIRDAANFSAVSKHIRPYFCSFLHGRLQLYVYSIEKLASLAALFKHSSHKLQHKIAFVLNPGALGTIYVKPNMCVAKPQLCDASWRDLLFFFHAFWSTFRSNQSLRTWLHTHFPCGTLFLIDHVPVHEIEYSALHQDALQHPAILQHVMANPTSHMYLASCACNSNDQVLANLLAKDFQAACALIDLIRDPIPIVKAVSVPTDCPGSNQPCLCRDLELLLQQLANQPYCSLKQSKWKSQYMTLVDALLGFFFKKKELFILNKKKNPTDVLPNDNSYYERHKEIKFLACRVMAGLVCDSKLVRANYADRLSNFVHKIGRFEASNLIVFLLCPSSVSSLVYLLQPLPWPVLRPEIIPVLGRDRLDPRLLLARFYPNGPDYRLSKIGQHVTEFGVHSQDVQKVLKFTFYS